MKKLLTIFGLSLIFHCLTGQYYFPNIVQYKTISTPLSSSIEGIKFYQLSTYQINDALNYLSSFSGIDIIESPTSAYNCHSYAWNISQNSDPEIAWINEYDSYSYPNLEKYWTDGSYIEVSGISTADIIHYTGDHSAVKYSSSMYKSKWGYNCLVVHSPNNVPSIYGTSNKYYSSFKMSSPDILCMESNGTFQTPDYTNCTFTWTYDSEKLDIVSGQGTNNFVVTPKEDSQAGRSWVSLSLHINSPISRTRVITKYFWVGIPRVDFVTYSNSVNGESYWCSSNYGNAFAIDTPYLDIPYEARLLSWPSLSVISTNSAVYSGTDPFGFEPSGWYVFQIRGTNGCGTSEWYESEIEYLDCSNDEDFKLFVYPNPATAELSVKIKKMNPLLNIPYQNDKIKYDFFRSYNGQPIKSYIFDSFQSEQKINISDLSPGSYILLVTIGKYHHSVKVLIK
jgi:hypothetical protein